MSPTTPLLRGYIGCAAAEPWTERAIILEAAAYAVRMHGDQKRKYTDEPYVLHCIEVAGLVASRPNVDPGMIAAALLHDVVEDTDVTLDEVQAIFGGRVATLVEWLTDHSKPEDGNRAARKAIDRDRLAEAPADAQTIKLADLISNTQLIVQCDPGFAKVYLAEKRELLAVLTGGDALLHRVAMGWVERGIRELGL